MNEKVNKRIQQREETLDRIRGVIDDLVSKVGYEKLTIRDICKHSNITVGTFYHYFSSKDDIILDRYKRKNKNFKVFYENEVKDLEVIEGLKKFSDYYIEYVKSRVFQLVVEYQRVLSSHGGSYEDIEENIIRATIRDMIKIGIEEKRIKDTYNEEQIADMMWCILTGISRVYCLTNGELLNRDDSIKYQVHDLIDSLRNI